MNSWMTRRIARENAEREIQANSHHSWCKGERCMASAANGYAHSRECIDEAGEAQGWTPTAEDYAKCGPSAGCCGAVFKECEALDRATERAFDNADQQKQVVAAEQRRLEDMRLDALRTEQANEAWRKADEELAQFPVRP